MRVKASIGNNTQAKRAKLAGVGLAVACLAMCASISACAPFFALPYTTDIGVLDVKVVNTDGWTLEDTGEGIFKAVHDGEEVAEGWFLNGAEGTAAVKSAIEMTAEDTAKPEKAQKYAGECLVYSTAGDFKDLGGIWGYEEVDIVEFEGGNHAVVAYRQLNEDAQGELASRLSFSVGQAR